MLILPMPPGDTAAGAGWPHDAARRVDDAGESLARRARQAAYLLALQLLGNADQARDVAQETMVRFYRHQDRLDPQRSVKPWILQVVRNQVKDLWRRKRVRREQPLEPAIADFSAELEDPAPGPDQNALRHEKQRLVWAALASMSASSREILVLRDFHDLTYDQMAAVLKIPVGTVMSRLHRARQSLREMLAGGRDATPDANQEGA
jgi:RNA polymerase sigma-70 factor (ECF subfamily)